MYRMHDVISGKNLITFGIWMRETEPVCDIGELV